MLCEVPPPRMQSAKLEIHVILVVKFASWEGAICLTISDSSYPFWCESVEKLPTSIVTSISSCNGCLDSLYTSCTLPFGWWSFVKTSTKKNKLTSPRLEETSSISLPDISMDLLRFDWASFYLTSQSTLCQQVTSPMAIPSLFTSMGSTLPCGSNYPSKIRS